MHFLVPSLTLLENTPGSLKKDYMESKHVEDKGNSWVGFYYKKNYMWEE